MTDRVTTKTPVVTYMERWPCPVDGCQGEMRFNGRVDDAAIITKDGRTYPCRDYEHICTVCKRRDDADCGYPKIVYEYVKP